MRDHRLAFIRDQSSNLEMSHNLVYLRKPPLEMSVSRCAASEKTKCANCESCSQLTRRCGNCLVTYYCTGSCQRQHWQNDHRNMCDFIKMQFEREEVDDFSDDDEDGDAPPLLPPISNAKTPGIKGGTKRKLVKTRNRLEQHLPPDLYSTRRVNFNAVSGVSAQRPRREYISRSLPQNPHKRHPRRNPVPNESATPSLKLPSIMGTKHISNQTIMPVRCKEPKGRGETTSEHFLGGSQMVWSKEPVPKILQHAGSAKRIYKSMLAHGFRYG